MAAAAAVNGGDLSNEDWLVTRARACARTDPYAAKAWMITARSLFPRNFNIQFEAYNLEKIARNTKEAAKLLENLYLSFPDEGKLWSEIHAILDALQTDVQETRSHFLTEILAAIPTHIQCQMLLNVAEKIGDKLQQCRLMLLTMRKFPDLINEHGLKLIESLLTAENNGHYQSAVNCFRKLLISDVLPLVLQRGKHLDLQAKTLYLWLQKAIEFYVCFVVQPPSQDLPPNTPLSPDLMSPTKKSRRLSIAGLQEKESQVPDPWGSLFKVLTLLGQQLRWDIEADFFSKSREFQWQHILSLYNRSNQSGSDSHNKQILYTTTVLFLECLYGYISTVDPDVFHTGTASSVPLVIIEGFKTDKHSSGRPSSAKRPKAESILPQVHAADSVPNSEKIIQNFHTAFKCYELLHSSPDIQREFISLCQSWHMETWSWMGHFQTDMFLYQGAFQDAVRHLQSYSGGQKNKAQVRNSLQLACCFYAMNNYSKSCELVLDVIDVLPESTQTDSQTDRPGGDNFSYGPGRHLVLVPCSEAEILPYCIQLLLTCLKEQSFKLRRADNSVGHMMVLMQYDWPRHEELFSEVVKKILKQGSFTYNIFFNYIINIDMLEEFAYLRSQEGGKVTLDILPVSTKTIQQQRTVTRGVNKGVREDFRVTMEKQVGRCEESVEKLIRTFLVEERPMVLQNLE